MSLQTVCFLGIGLWAIITFFVISALVVAGKSDEKLGYKTPLEELLPESDRFDSTPSIPRQPLYDPGKSEGLST
jgi:hypothetical protein